MFDISFSKPTPRNSMIIHLVYNDNLFSFRVATGPGNPGKSTAIFFALEKFLKNV